MSDFNYGPPETPKPRTPRTYKMIAFKAKGERRRGRKEYTRYNNWTKKHPKGNN